LDPSFSFDRIGLEAAIGLLQCQPPSAETFLPSSLPEDGLGEVPTLRKIAPMIVGKSAKLGQVNSFAHMDPPTPWISWAISMWTAALNQNLLHPATAPVARLVEQRVVDWLAEPFGMDGGHVVPGSTIANLTALWVARERKAITDVYASDKAHVSIRKSADLLGLRFRPIASDRSGRMLPVRSLPPRSALVLTAGHTSSGAIDPLDLETRAAWRHVDAAWGGPLRLTKAYRHLLDGIERADSVAFSPHKLLFQPKECGLVLFKDTARAHAAITYAGPYLGASNVGLLGSHGAAACALLATLLAFGRSGMDTRISHCMRTAEAFANFIEWHAKLELLEQPSSGVVLWRPKEVQPDHLAKFLPAEFYSKTVVEGKEWFRNVSANPNVSADALRETIEQGLARAGTRSPAGGKGTNGASSG
jgi:L-2,4-diaminobutyrate decarboxylase